MTKELGKIPPQAIDIEEIVLGAILLESRCISLVRSILTVEHFYKEQHQIIFASICKLSDNGEPIDLATVASNLRNYGKLESIGGALALSQLTDRVASTAHIEAHARIIVQKYIARQTIQINSESIADSFNNEDPFEIVESSITKLFHLIDSSTNKNEKSIEDYLKLIEEQQQRIHEGITPGIESFLPTYNKVSGGYHSGELIIIAGRPGMGKTANMMNEVHHNLEKGLSVVIHSLEMTGDKLISILIAIHFKIPVNLITREKMPLELLKKSIKWVRSKRLKIFENVNLHSIRLNTLLWKASKGCDVVYVDYLQLIQTGQAKTIDNVGKASMGLKRLAKEIENPLIALAQLSRSVETRGGDKKPILSDLRESGQIEQDADVVDFMYRPEYYGMTQDEVGNSYIGKAFRINAKRRSGSSGQEILMEWRPEMQILKEPIEPDFNTISMKSMGDGFDGEDVPF